MSAILASAEEGQQLIDRIHRATRLGVGRSRTAANVNNLLAAAADDVKSLGGSQSTTGGGEIVWEMALGDLPETYLNTVDVKEVFTNLMLNATEAMASGGRLEASSSVSGDAIEIRIRDTGSGMSDHVVEHAFDPFYTTKEQTGLGLGLSIVLRILEDHGGSIALQIEESVESTFMVSLPVVTDAPVELVAEGDDAEAHLDR